MHFIQKHILDELRTVDEMRYAQLCMHGVESGHFRYHLQQLVKDGYVEQMERGLYRLSATGQSYVDKLSENRMNPMAMPKVITYTLLTDGDKILLQNKTKQPYMNQLNMIGGKLHEGEIAMDAAVREVYEKTERTIENLKLRGVFEILINKDGNQVTHAVAFVHETEVQASDFNTAGLQVVDRNDLSSLTNLAPDFMPIYKKLVSNKGVQFGSVVVTI
jgi:ADP-ribose pyrophosphatase YjhB (NUDIX family)